MNSVFSTYHPFTLFVWYASVIGISMFSSNPVITAVSFCGAFALAAVCCGNMGAKSVFSYLFMFLLIAAVNPLFSHNGRTALFFMNSNPVTLESVCYGLSAAGTIISVIVWFRSFSKVMTSDKILCITGAAMPGVSIVLSTAIRFIPLFRERIKKVRDTGKALGLFSKDNFIDKFRGGVRAFSIMVTWSLESAIETSDSMRARGFGTVKRTSFSPFRFTRRDVIFSVFTLVLLALCMPGIFMNALSVSYYPVFTPPAAGVYQILLYAAFSALVFFPSIWEAARRKG